MFGKAFTIGAAIVISAPAMAQSADDLLDARAAEIAGVLQGSRPAAETFSPEFLAAIPAEKLLELVGQISAQAGKLTGADEIKRAAPGAATFLLRFEKANARASLQLDPKPPHKVIGFRVTEVVPADDGPPKLLEDFAALPGSSAFGVYKLTGGEPQPVLTLHPERQLAIGSAFKLWVLDAVAEEVASGRLKWDQVVPLGARSLPSGMTQDWPENAPVTVETLATLMISISDNTATDTLIRLVGRDRVAARVRASRHSAPDKILPFLTTGEAFALKLGPAAVRDAYGKASDAEQAATLARLDPAKVFKDADFAALADKPVAIDTVEWLASSADLARVLDTLRRRSDPRVMAILGVTPGMSAPHRAAFRGAGFKGGSETGVINLSWVLQRPDGEWYAVTAGWNDPAAPVDNTRFAALAARLVGLLEK